MKIIKYGNDEGIVFNNGNSLWDTYSQIERSLFAKE